MTPLEHELVDLGDHLDHGPGDDLAARVRARLRTPPRRASAPLWVKVAAAVVLALAVAVAVGPTRRALARLVGIGAVEIRPTPTTARRDARSPDPSRTVPGQPSPAASGAVADNPDLGAAQARVAFPIAVAPRAEWGPLRNVQVDDRVPGGLVALAYDRFTLVELASAPDAYPVMAKMAPPEVTVTFTTVGTADAIWVQGAHDIAYVAPDGSVATDTVRRSGSVLLWTRNAVTYRIEGFDAMADAVRAAEAVA